MSSKEIGGNVSEEVHFSGLSGQTDQLAAKLTLPWQGYLLKRPRLNEAVNRLQLGGLVSVVAGPGYGKTALLVDLLKNNEGPCAYYALDEEDREPGTFVRGLLAAVGQIDPSAAREGRERLGSSSHISRDCSDAIAAVAAHLARNEIPGSGGRITLALDEMQFLPERGPALHALERFIETLPSGWTVLLASRRGLVMSSMRKLLAQGRRLHLEGRRMRLTPLEVRAWAAAAWGLKLDLAEARAVWRLTEGWPVALVLMGERLRRLGRLGERVGIMALLRKGTDLNEYLEREVFSSLESSVTELLMRAWPFPRVSFPRDEEFLPEGGESLLEELAERGFLVRKSGHHIFSLHPLVRAYAEREMTRTTPEAARTLSRAAASHLRSAGFNREAASLLLRIGDVDAAVKPLRTLAMEALNASTPSMEAEWLELLPEEVVATEPWLLLVRGRILQGRGDYEGARLLYRASARLFEQQKEMTGRLQSLLGEALCLYVLGRWEESLGSLGKAERVTSNPAQRAEVLCNTAGVLLALCRWDDAVERLEVALAQSQPIVRRALEARVDVYRARLFFLRGLYETGAQWAERAVRKSSGVGHELYATALNASATLLQQLGRYHEALLRVEASMALVKSRHWTFMEGPVSLCAAGVYLGLERYREGIENAKRAKDIAQKAQDVETEVWAEDLLGDVCRRNRSPQKARVHHERALELCHVHNLSSYEVARSTCGLAMDLAANHENEAAAEILAQAIAPARKYGLTSVLAMARMYDGWLQACGGQERMARASLAEALRLAQDGCHVHALVQEAPVALAIYGLCARYGMTGFLQNMVIPKLSLRLQKRYAELSEGSVYPLDVPLGARGGAHGRVVHRAEERASGAEEQAVAERVEQLTDREMEILKMVGLGLPNKLIAAKLFIAEKTVKTHTNRMFRKLGVTNRLQAVLALQAYQRYQKSTRSFRSHLR
ncbi:MAG: hypothetical protein GX604_04035 [Actinobacteria bacterium]|nr:hypothetical protein [Actinomycetota bacterium]